MKKTPLSKTSVFSARDAAFSLSEVDNY